MNIFQKDNTRQLLWPVTQAINTVMGLPACIWLLDETERIFQISVAAELLEEYVRDAYLSMDEPCIAADVFRTGETIIVPTISDEGQWKYKTEGSRMGLKSAIVSPLWIKNKFVGVLDVYIPESRSFDPDELKPKVESFAEQIGTTLRQIWGMETLKKVGQLINSQIQDIPLLLKNIMRSAQQVLGCEHVSIFLKEETSGDLVLEKSSTNELRRNRFKSGEGLAGLVVQTGESLCVQDALKHPQYVPGVCLKTEERSMLLSPIKSENGEVIGVISADIVGLNGFDSQELLWLDTLTNQAAMAIKNAQVYYLVNQRRKAMVDIGKKLTEKIYLKENEVYELIYEQVTQKLRVDNFFIALYDEKNGMIRFVIACSEGELVPVNSEEGWKNRKWADGHKVEAIISTNHYLLLNTRKEIEDRFGARREKKMASSWLGVPMHFGENTLGIIATYSYEQEHFFNQDDVDIFQALADLASVAIENVRLYAQRADDIACLQDINKAVISKNQSEILQLIVEKAVETMPGEYSSLWLIEHESGDLVLEAVHGPAETKAWEIKRLKKAEENSINRLVADTGKPYRCPDVEQEPRFFKIYENAKSSVTVPLRYQDSIIGTLNVESSRLSAFTEQHAQFLDSLSDQAAIAIENFRLYRQSQNQRKVLTEAIGQISTSVASPSESDIERILDNIFKWTLALMGKASLGEIRLLDKETNELVVRASQGGVINPDYHRISIDEGITGWVARNRRSMSVPDVSQDSRYLAFIEGTKSEIAVPIMKGQEEIFGVFNIEYPKISAFTDEDVRLAEAIADLASIAIENATLYEEIQKSRDELNLRVKERTAELKAAYDISEATHHAKKLEDIYPKIHEIIKKLIPSAENNFQIGIYDYTKESFNYDPFVKTRTFPYFRDEFESAPPSKPVHIEKGLSDYVLQTGEPLLGTPEVLAELSAQKKIKRIGKHSKSWLGVPLKTQDKTIGVMTVHSYDEDVIYGKEELDALLFVSEQVAMSIERVRRKKEKAVLTLGKVLTSSALRNENELLQRIYNNASELMDTDNMYIALYDSQKNIVRFGLAYKGGRKINTNMEEMEEEEKGYQPRPFGKGKTEAIIQSRKPIFHPTKADAEAWYNRPEHYAYDPGILPSWVGVPMIIGDKVLGVIATYHPEKEYVYSESDVEILQAMANIAAIALENARLYRELEERADKLRAANREIAEKEELLTRSMLASDFVHDLNNLAGTIPVWANILKEKTEDLIFSIQRDVNKLLREGERLKKPALKEDIDMSALLQSLFNNIRLQYYANAEIEMRNKISEDLHSVQAVKAHLSNAISNVIQNGVESVLEKRAGTVKIKAENHTENDHDGVRIEITDMGRGISEENMEKIFEHDFTTRGEGRGYGLWRTKHTIEKYSGRIRVSSQEGKGTSVVIFLPRSKGIH